MIDLKDEIEKLKQQGFDNQQIYEILVYRQMNIQKQRRTKRMRLVRVLFMN